MKKILRLAGILILVSACTPSNILDEHKFQLSGQEVNSNNLSCETIADSSAFQFDPMKEGEISFKLTKGTDKIALTIGDKFLSLITGAAVGQGISESEKWPIIENTNEYLLAASHHQSAFGSSIYSFALNKKSGFAVWTKVEPNFLYVPAAGGFIQYLTCK